MRSSSDDTSGSTPLWRAASTAARRSVRGIFERPLMVAGVLCVMASCARWWARRGGKLGPAEWRASSSARVVAER